MQITTKHHSTKKEASNAYDIIIDWLKARIAIGGLFVYNYELETKCQLWGRKHFGKQYMASTYTRRWREVVERGLYKEIGIERLEEFTKSGNKGWRLIMKNQTKNQLQQHATSK